MGQGRHARVACCSRHGWSGSPKADLLEYAIRIDLADDMQALPFADMPATLGPLLARPGIPASVRRLQRQPPHDVTFGAREATDAEGLFTLFSERSFRENALTRDPFESTNDFETWLATVGGPRRYEIVAKQQGRLLGFAGLYPQVDHMRHVGSLMLGVTSAAQGKGVGSFLLQLVIWTAWAVEGLAKLQLTVFCDNEPAISLYRAAGFEVEGTLRHFVSCDGKGRDAYAMALFLD